MKAFRFPIHRLATAMFAGIAAGGGFCLETTGEERSGEEPAAVEAAALDDLVDGMGQASLQEAFRLLREDYIKREALSYLELNRAAFQGLLERLDFGAMLLTRADREARDSPFGFHAEPLGERIGYARFGKFKKEEIEELDAAIAVFAAEPGRDTLILDLRSPQAMADFEIAASILSRFRPAGELLFQIRRPREERPRLFTSRGAPRLWNRRLMVLIDGETGNVGEIIAEALRQQSGSLVIGEPTPGMTVEYRDVPVGEDRILRYAVAEVVLPRGDSLFQVGVTPDLVTPSPPEVKRVVFGAAGERPLAGFVFDRGRPRMNEAALVARTDPELDFYVARSGGRQTEWDQPISRDRVLRQAVDLLVAAPFLPEQARDAEDQKAGDDPGEKEAADEAEPEGEGSRPEA